VSLINVRKEAKLNNTITTMFKEGIIKIVYNYAIGGLAVG